MKVVFCVLLTTILLPSAKVEAQRHQPAALANDELILGHQFLRWYFPQIAGRDADLQFRAEMGLFYAKPNQDADWARPRPLTFEVVDWCPVEMQPGAIRICGAPPLACTEKYKDYKRPLWGQLVFIPRNGRIVLYEAWLHGALLDTAESGWPVKSCYLTKPATTKALVERLQLRHLAVLLGGRVRVLEVNGGVGVSGRVGELGWNAHIEVSQGSKHIRYFFSLDDCGSIESLGPVGW